MINVEKIIVNGKRLFLALEQPLKFLFNLVLLAIIIGTVLIAGPIVDGKFFPVIKNIKIERIPVDEKSELPVPNHALFSISGDYVRECPLVRITAMHRDEDNRISTHRTAVEIITGDFLTNVSNVSNMKVGSYGPSVIKIEASNFNIISIVHRCQPLWETSTSILLPNR